MADTPQGAGDSGAQTNGSTDAAVRPTGVAAAAVGQIGGFLLASTVLAVLFYDAKTDNKIEPGLLPILSQFPMLWAGLLATLVFVARRRSETIRELTVFRVLPKDVLYLGIGVALQFGGGLIYSLVGKNSEAGESAKDLINNARNNTPGFFVLAAFVGLGAPLIEELFYRGLVARGFERLFSRRAAGSSMAAPLWLAVFLSALWFAAIHLQALQFPLLFVVGAVCAWLTLYWKRLGPAIFVHMGFNLTTVVALGLDLLNS